MAIWTGFEDPKYDLVEKADPNKATLRDQFAMAALTGLCAHPDCEGTYKEIANQVYRLADAMLAAREAK